MKEHIHKEPGEESLANPWACTVMEEGRMTCGGRDFLYVVGDARIGSSCVGAGTLRYIQVPGYIGRWKYRVDNNGDAVSDVEPVADEKNRADIRKILSEKYNGLQVCF